MGCCTYMYILKQTMVVIYSSLINILCMSCLWYIINNVDNVHKSYICTQESIDPPLNLVQVSTCTLFALFHVICMQHLIRLLFSVKMVYSITVYRFEITRINNGTFYHYNNINMHACWLKLKSYSQTCVHEISWI